MLKRYNKPGLSLSRQLGFTIIELMIGVLVAGVLATVALPSFGDMLKRNRLTAQANSVLAALNYARNETINRGADVLIEPITTGTDNWGDGWKVNVGGTLIRNFDATKGSSLKSSAGTITYESTGSLKGTAAITLTLSAKECTSGKEYVRVITLSPSGHARVSRSTCS
jgi:type IV fimbrial biogenesis protein FimT